jgi:hypothetical protein
MYYLYLLHHVWCINLNVETSHQQIKRNRTCCYTFKVFFHRRPWINSRQTQLGFFTAYALSTHRHITMQVLSYILLAIMLFFGAFGPGARTCYAVRYVNKMEHSRMGLRAFEKRTIPKYRVFSPNPNRSPRSRMPLPPQQRPPTRPPQQRPPPPGTIY